jgi:hypothetical protein
MRTYLMKFLLRLPGTVTLGLSLTLFGLCLSAWAQRRTFPALDTNGAFTSINGITVVDGVKYPCTSAGVNSAIAAQIALGGGTVDARGCASLSTYTSEIDVGNSSSVAIELLVPHTGTWLCNITNGVSFCLKVFNNSSIVGSNPSFGSFQIRPASSIVSVGAFIGNDTSVAGAHIRVEGFEGVLFSTTATVAKAIGYFSGLGDGSYIGHMTFANLSSTNAPKVMWVNNSCCATTIEDVVVDAFAISGVTPCWFGNGTTGPNLNIKIDGISCTHAGSGASDIVEQEWNQFANNVFKNVYMENLPGADTTTPWISVQAFGSPSAADLFIGVTAGGDVASSTRYTVDIASGAHAIITSLQQGSVSTNAINDHNGSGVTVTAAANSSVGGYSTEEQFLTNTLQLAGGGSIKLPNLLLTATTPTISSGFGTSPSIQFNNGSPVMQVNVGSGGTASSGVIGMPTASVGWSCSVENLTAHLRNRADDTVQTASTTTTVTVQNQTKTTGAAVAWTASDVLRLNCMGF